MPSYAADQTETVAATPQQCFDALVDYEQLPRWQGGLRSATVVEAFPGGHVVDYELDAKVRTVRYRLRKVADGVGLDPLDPRDAWVLQVSLALGRLSDGGRSWRESWRESR